MDQVSLAESVRRARAAQEAVDAAGMGVPTYEELAPRCAANGHPYHPIRQRVIDFAGNTPIVRIKFLSESCPCGDRLNVTAFSVREVEHEALAPTAEAAG